MRRGAMNNTVTTSRWIAELDKQIHETVKWRNIAEDIMSLCGFKLCPQCNGEGSTKGPTGRSRKYRECEQRGWKDQ